MVSLTERFFGTKTPSYIEEKYGIKPEDVEETSRMNDIFHYIFEESKEIKTHIPKVLPEETGYSLQDLQKGYEVPKENSHTPEVTYSSLKDMRDMKQLERQIKEFIAIRPGPLC